ncbi:hypothetical protein evm_014551 [Chilo suppressalis]|nr:hypothetical protein evm_014551 [Chilo suppressalis]
MASGVTQENAVTRKATTIPPATTTKFVITRQLYGNFTPQMQSYPIKDRETKVQLEGVDYDLMPPEMYERNHDCRANYHVCIRYSSTSASVVEQPGYMWTSPFSFQPSQKLDERKRALSSKNHKILLHLSPDMQQEWGLPFKYLIYVGERSPT